MSVMGPRAGIEYCVPGYTRMVQTMLQQLRVVSIQPSKNNKLETLGDFPSILPWKTRPTAVIFVREYQDTKYLAACYGTQTIPELVYSIVQSRSDVNPRMLSTIATSINSAIPTVTGLINIAFIILVGQRSIFLTSGKRSPNKEYRHRNTIAIEKPNP